MFQFGCDNKAFNTKYIYLLSYNLDLLYLYLLRRECELTKKKRIRSLQLGA